MAKRRFETERSTDRSIDRKKARAGRDTVPTPPPDAAVEKPPPDVPAPAKLPSAPRPGRRGEAPSDIILTQKMERLTVEPTPAPLPPSPAAADADRWFEQVPTNPGAPQTPTDRRGSTSRVPLVDPSQVAAQGGAPTWMFPLLLALTALTVGMVIGALVFGGAGGATCEPCGTDAGATP